MRSFCLFGLVSLLWSVPALTWAEPKKTGIAEDPMSDPGVVEHMLGASWASVDREIELRDIDKQALSATSRWKSGADGAPPSAGADGRVVFEFGTLKPRVICAQLHVCDIELQAGELVYDTKAGDDEQWIIGSANTDSVMHVTVKPKVANLDTNLFIYTNRRTYLIDIVSTADERAALTDFIAFSYPEDTKAQWARLRARMASRPEGRAPSMTLDSANQNEDDPSTDYELHVRPGSLHLGYTVKKAGRWMTRRRIHWMPVRVYDDGQKTFIVMPKRLQEEPVFVVNDNGQNAVVNLRWKGRVMIVDRLFDRATMMIGAGWWYQQKVTITRVEE